LHKPTHAAGIVRRPVFNVGERDLEAFPLARDDVLLRHAHVLERDDAVIERAQTHEAAAERHLEAGRVHVDDERGDLLPLFPFTIFGAVFAMTTSTPALRPFVHQSFSPFMM
jgi:hypothetical protein